MDCWCRPDIRRRKELEMKRLFVFFVIVFVGAYASAQTMQVSVEDAIMAMQVRVGLNAGCENVSAVGMNVLRNSRGDTLLYEIESNCRQTVLVSGHKSCIPVLGVHDREEGSYIQQYELLPEGLQSLLDSYLEQIDSCFSQQDSTTNVSSDWQSIYRREYPRINRNGGVAPLLSSYWTQKRPNGWQNIDAYNYYIEEGDGCQHCLVGCVAVAMGQVMYYWNYPVIMNRKEKQFDWCKMSPRLDYNSTSYEENRNAIAYLLQQCGAAVDMSYGCDASGAYTSDVPDALISFGYSNSADFKRRIFHTNDAWKSMIKVDLDNAQPIIYKGRTALIGGNGHSFVCDGYNEYDEFHFNWGWGDQNQYNGLDNFFTLDSLHSDHNYIYEQGAVFGIKPAIVQDMCNHTLDLVAWYLSFYNGQNTYIPFPYKIVPSTTTVLISANISAPEEWRTIPAGAQTTYQAHKEIILKEGFTVERGAEFTARIEPCTRCEDRFVQGQAPQDDSPRGITGDVSDVRVEQGPSQTFTMPSQIQLFPNPTSEDVTIAVDGEVESVMVFNTMGMPMGGWRIRALSVQQVTLDMSSMSSGMYIVVVKKTDGQVVYGRIVKN